MYVIVQELIQVFRHVLLLGSQYETLIDLVPKIVHKLIFWVLFW